MKNKEVIIKRMETIKHYHMRGMPRHIKRAKNAIYFTPANGLKHELKKAEVCYNLLKERKWFITEAVDNKLELIRDVVCLDDGTIYEIETDKRRAKRFEQDPEKSKVIVVMVE